MQEKNHKYIHGALCMARLLAGLLVLLITTGCAMKAAEPAASDIPTEEVTPAPTPIPTSEPSPTPTPEPKPEPGFHLQDGLLQFADEEGNLVRDGWVGSLYFGADGLYTSGNPELDGYVRSAIRENTTPDMTQEDCLHAMYLYVRDSFTYLTRNYHLIGDLGVAIDEALTMYSTGKGNCYNYAAAFWAAARGVGYDARFVSGTVDKGHSPHGWVEIYIDGVRRTYDTELEMAQHRDGKTETDLYGITDKQRTSWMYIESAYTDMAVPRENADSVRTPWELLPTNGSETGERFLTALEMLGGREPLFSLTEEQREFIISDETLWDITQRRNNYVNSPYRYKINYMHSVQSIFDAGDAGSAEWIAINNFIVTDCFTVDFGGDISFTCITCANYYYQNVRLILPGTTSSPQLNTTIHAYAVPLSVSEFTNSAGEKVPCLVALGVDCSM